MDTEEIHASDIKVPLQERGVSADTIAESDIPKGIPKGRGEERCNNTGSLHRNSRGDSSRGGSTDLTGLSAGTDTGTSRSTSQHELPRSHAPVTKVGVSPRLWRGLYNVVALGVALFNYAFTPEEHRIRASFARAIQQCRLSILTRPHRMLPEIDAMLARIQAADLAIKNGTWICIAGLEHERDILEFHAFWLRRENKKSIPFKLCYSPIRISKTARATCAIRRRSDRTLCGALIDVQGSESAQRTSTIGGLLKVNGRLFALTTRHRPETSSRSTEVDNHGLRFGPDSLLIPNDEAFETDSQEFWERFLLLSGEEQDGEEQDGEEKDGEDVNRLAHSPISIAENRQDEAESLDQSQSADAPTGEGNFSFHMNEDRIQVGRDWQLVPVQPEKLLPNEIEQPDGQARDQSNRHAYIENICDDLGKKFEHDPVSPRWTWVISGMGGLKNCSMLPTSSSMISTYRGVQEVWKIVFDGQDLEAGDSGSWVVDRADLQLLGVAVARSPGVGYVVPFESVRKDIAKTLRLRSELVGLPSKNEPAFRRRPNNRLIRPPPAQSDGQPPADVPIEGNDTQNALVGFTLGLRYILPIAVGYMALLLAHDDGLHYSRRSQILVFPIFVLVFWAAWEVFSYFRPINPARQRVQRNFRPFFFDLFLVILTVACLGVSGAHLWRSNFFSTLRTYLASGDLRKKLKKAARMMKKLHWEMSKMRDTPAGHKVYLMYRRALDWIWEVLDGIRRRIQAVIRALLGF